MATYKVIQDIEAEDKLLGPLSFRQFVYFLAGAFLAFLDFTMLTKGAAFLLIFFLPPTVFCFFFAFPWTPDQPTEVWALARIRYYFKPRKRLWNQSGVKEFVTITVPKKIEKAYTDGLTQEQVRSRLQALSQTIDSRGWAVKNVLPGSAGAIVHPGSSDRLVGFDSMPQEVSNFDIHDSDDILDERNNPAAYQMDQMIDASSKARRQQLMDKLRAQGATPPAAPPAPEWFQHRQAAAAATQASPVGTLPTVPIVSHNEPLLTTRQPQPAPAPAPAPQPQAEPIKTQPDPVILNLAHDNDKDIATLAREAKRAHGDIDDGEVVISLR